MDIVNVGTVGHCDHNVSSEYKALYAEIQTLRAKVALADELRKALDMFVKDCTGEIIHSTNWMSQQGKKAIANYDKISEVKPTNTEVGE